MKNLHYRGRLFHSRLSHTLTLFCFIFFGTALSVSAQETWDLWTTNNNGIKMDSDNTGSQNTIWFGSKVNSVNYYYPPYPNGIGYISAGYTNLRDWKPYVNKEQEYTRDFQRMDFGYYLESASTPNHQDHSDNRTREAYNLMSILANGNVGIRTVTPNALLDIRGGNGYYGVGGLNLVAFQYVEGGYRHWISTRHKGTDGPTAGNSIDFYLNNSNWGEGSAGPTVGTVHGMSITGVGVGIGTTQPEQKLHVEGTILATGFKLPTGAGAGKILVSDSQGTATWETNSGNASWLLSGISTTTTKRVGIATTTPAGLLDIKGGADRNGSNGDFPITIQLYSGGYRHWITTRHSALSTPDNGNAIDFYLNNSSTAEGSASPHVGTALGMSITTKGVGIGTEDPSFKLDVAGRGRIQASDATSTGTAGIFFTNSDKTENRGFIGMVNDNNIGFWGAGGSGWGLTMNVVTGRVGIGTSNPTTTLDVRGPASFYLGGDNGPQVDISSNTLNTAGWIGTANKYGFYIGTNKTAQVYLDTTDNVFIGFVGVPIPEAPNARNKFDLFVHRGILTEDYALAPKSSWSDYVFEDNYPLEKLSEVEAYIRKNKHLPNIPSQEEVAKEGYTVHDMTRKFLEKIEELTLHAIHQDKEITQLKQQLRGYENLTSDIQALKAQLDKK